MPSVWSVSLPTRSLQPLTASIGSKGEAVKDEEVEEEDRRIREGEEEDGGGRGEARGVECR